MNARLNEADRSVRSVDRYTNILVKFENALYMDAVVFFIIYYNKVFDITIFISHLIFKVQILFTNVQKFTLIHIEKHKPLDGPLT